MRFIKGFVHIPFYLDGVQNCFKRFYFRQMATTKIGNLNAAADTTISDLCFYPSKYLFSVKGVNFYGKCL